MFDKKINWKFFGKARLSSISPSGNVESRSDNSPDNFPPKVFVFHKFLKNSPTPLPPFWKKLSNWTFFQEKKFSRRSVSEEKKTQFWQSAFKVQKTSAECLEKFLKTLIEPRKKTVYLKKPSWIVCTVLFWQSCWIFSKTVRFLFLIFTKTDKTDCSISEKKLSDWLKFTR